VICGHIHWAQIRDIGGLTYVNCGDWVDSCTAIVEHFDGTLELVSWGSPLPQRQLVAPPVEASLPPVVVPVAARVGETMEA
jgi:hypothetical protein